MAGNKGKKSKKALKQEAALEARLTAKLKSMQPENPPSSVGSVRSRTESMTSQDRSPGSSPRSSVSRRSGRTASPEVSEVTADSNAPVISEVFIAESVSQQLQKMKDSFMKDVSVSDYNTRTQLNDMFGKLVDAQMANIDILNAHKDTDITDSFWDKLILKDEGGNLLNIRDSNPPHNLLEGDALARAHKEIVAERVTMNEAMINEIYASFTTDNTKGECARIATKHSKDLMSLWALNEKELKATLNPESGLTDVEKMALTNLGTKLERDFKNTRLKVAIALGVFIAVAVFLPEIIAAAGVGYVVGQGAIGIHAAISGLAIGGTASTGAIAAHPVVAGLSAVSAVLLTGVAVLSSRYQELNARYSELQNQVNQPRLTDEQVRTRDQEIQDKMEAQKLANEIKQDNARLLTAINEAKKPLSEMGRVSRVVTDKLQTKTVESKLAWATMNAAPLLEKGAGWLVRKGTKILDRVTDPVQSYKTAAAHIRDSKTPKPEAGTPEIKTPGK